MSGELDKYSYSKITHFYNCPYSFYKHYFDEEKGDSAGVSEFGKFMHSIMEEYETGKLKIDDLVPYYINNYSNNVCSDFTLFMSAYYSKDFSDYYYNKGLDYLTNFKGFPNWKILKVEHLFNTNIQNKFILTGRIDLIALDNKNKLIICDHKSKTKFKSKKEIKEYARQLYSYSYAIYLLYNKYPDYLVFNLFSDSDKIIIPFNKKDYKETIDWLICSVEQIENCFDFYANYGTFYCRNFCAYRKKHYPECNFDNK